MINERPQRVSFPLAGAFAVSAFFISLQLLPSASFIRLVAIAATVTATMTATGGNAVTKTALSAATHRQHARNEVEARPMRATPSNGDAVFAIARIVQLRFEVITESPNYKSAFDLNSTSDSGATLPPNYDVE
jgi:hypothetical protein